MTPYWTDELSVELPDGLVDRSTQLLEWSVDGDSVTVAIQRDSSEGRRSPQQMLAAASGELEKRFPHFAPEAAPAFELAMDHATSSFRWRREGRAVFQAQLYIEIGDRLLIVTASGLAKSRTAVEEVIKAFADSLELREK